MTKITFSVLSLINYLHKRSYLQYIKINIEINWFWWSNKEWFASTLAFAMTSVKKASNYFEIFWPSWDSTQSPTVHCYQGKKI